MPSSCSWPSTSAERSLPRPRSRRRGRSRARSRAGALPRRRIRRRRARRRPRSRPSPCRCRRLSVAEATRSAPSPTCPPSAMPATPIETTSTETSPRTPHIASALPKPAADQPAPDPGKGTRAGSAGRAPPPPASRRRPWRRSAGRCGGERSMRCRSAAGVSPVRVALLQVSFAWFARFERLQDGVHRAAGTQTGQPTGLLPVLCRSSPGSISLKRHASPDTQPVGAGGERRR